MLEFSNKSNLVPYFTWGKRFYKCCCILQGTEAPYLYEINNYVKLLIKSNMTNYKVEFTSY